MSVSGVSILAAATTPGGHSARSAARVGSGSVVASALEVGISACIA